ncbi:MAG: DUF4157 domain-containing protein [Chloroflexota bacterium]
MSKQNHKPENQQTKQVKAAPSSKQRTRAGKTAVSPSLSLLYQPMTRPESISPAEAQTLQRTIGNQALSRLTIQRKMTLGPVGDAYEQEADAVAKQVVGQLNTPQTAQRQEDEEELQMKPLAQRQEDEEELQVKPMPAISSLQRQEDEEELQMKPLAQRQEEEEELQAKSETTKGDPMLAGGELSGDVESSVQSAKAGGQPMPDNVRAPLENAFNTDFSSVKLHTDRAADSLNRSLSARAFTTGQDIFFRSGEYNPGSRAGQELMAHELTHVVQQTGTAVQPKTDKSLQRQETGIAQDDAIIRYTGSAKKVFDDWSTLTPQERANNLGKFVNDELKKAKSFPCNVNLKDLGGTSGEFDFQTWSLDLDSGILSKDAVSDEEANDLVDTVYHEARHSEQWFRMAQLRAGEGRTAQKIADELFIPANVAKEAANAPLEPLSEPARKLLSEEQAKLHDKSLLEAKAWYKSVYGDDAAHRGEVLGDIDNRYDDYRALAEEVDAWNVGGRVAAAFKLKQVIDKIL